jgi:hypothetical protein
MWKVEGGMRIVFELAIISLSPFPMHISLHIPHSTKKSNLKTKKP